MATCGCRLQSPQAGRPIMTGIGPGSRPWGWTWVDDAPWGFAPYHYGRWASFGGRWGWIPGPYGVTPVYAPALVAWIGGGRGGSGFSLSFSYRHCRGGGMVPPGSSRAVFPVLPGEPGLFHAGEQHQHGDQYHHHQQLLQSSRNSIRTISNIKYVNRKVRNGVTAVPQNTFASGRRVTQYARAVPAAATGPVQVFAAPAIAPQRESVLGVAGGHRLPGSASAGQCVEPARGGANRSSSGSGSRSTGSSRRWRRTPAALFHQLRSGRCARVRRRRVLRFASWIWAG